MQLRLATFGHCCKCCKADDNTSTTRPPWQGNQPSSFADATAATQRLPCCLLCSCSTDGTAFMCSTHEHQCAVQSLRKLQFLHLPQPRPPRPSCLCCISPLNTRKKTPVATRGGGADGWQRGRTQHMRCDQHSPCTLRHGTAAVKCILALPPLDPVFDTSFGSIQRALCPHSTLKDQF